MTVTAEQALEQARAAAELARRRAADLPPLHGVPTAIKDLTSTAGIRTTLGSRPFARNVPDTDAHAVTLLRAAGTISLGKTNTPEFGQVCYTDNDITGPARSPWDQRCNAGGSSGGAAAAVAAGLLPFAHGSDGGGSIRIPASVCGLVGLKPSRGRVSSGPVAADAPGLSIQGPITRTVRDAAAMLDALAHPMPGDPYWAPPLPPGETFLGYAGRVPGRLADRPVRGDRQRDDAGSGLRGRVGGRLRAAGLARARSRGHRAAVPGRGRALLQSDLGREVARP